MKRLYSASIISVLLASTAYLVAQAVVINISITLTPQDARGLTRFTEIYNQKGRQGNSNWQDVSVAQFAESRVRELFENYNVAADREQEQRLQEKFRNADAAKRARALQELE